MINFINEKCNGCRVCEKVCPQHVIEVRNKKAVMINYESCLECGACRLNCEQNAICLTKGTGCLIAIIKEDILKISPKNSGCCCS